MQANVNFRQEPTGDLAHKEIKLVASSTQTRKTLIKVLKGHTMEVRGKILDSRKQKLSGDSKINLKICVPFATWTATPRTYVPHFEN